MSWVFRCLGFVVSWDFSVLGLSLSWVCRCLGFVAVLGLLCLGFVTYWGGRALGLSCLGFVGVYPIHYILDFAKKEIVATSNTLEVIVHIRETMYCTIFGSYFKRLLIYPMFISVSYTRSENFKCYSNVVISTYVAIFVGYPVEHG